MPGSRSSQRETDAVNLTMSERARERESGRKWERETWTTQRL